MCTIESEVKIFAVTGSTLLYGNKCENGKKFQSLKDFDSSKSEVSLKFKGISSTIAFLSVWQKLMDSDINKSTTTPSNSPDLPSPSIPKAIRPRVILAENCSPNGTLATLPPTKKSRCMKDEMDDKIERCKIGKINLMF